MSSKTYYSPFFPDSGASGAKGSTIPIVTTGGIDDINTSIGGIQTKIDDIDGSPYFDGVAPPQTVGLGVVSSLVTNPDGSQIITITASWTASTASDLAYYRVAIKQGSGNYVEFLSSTNSYSWQVQGNQPFTVKVAATDKAGNTGGYSTEVSVTSTKDSTPPSAPTSLAVVASLSNLYLTWNNPADADLDHIEIWENTVNTQPNPTTQPSLRIANVNGAPSSQGAFARGIGTGNTRYYWVTAVDTSGNRSPFNASSGTVGTTPKITLPDFTTGQAPIGFGTSLPSTTGYTGPSTFFNQTDGKIYRLVGGAWVSSTAAADISGQITSAQIAAAAIDTTKFASGITPVEILSTLPTTGNFTGRTVMLTTDGKLYRYNGTAFVSSVTSTDITGQLTQSQLGNGSVGSAQIASAAIDNTKLVANLAAVEYVTSLPTTGNYAGRTVVLSTDGKLYRYVGSAFTAAVPTTDLTGTIASAQIAAGAVGTNQLAPNSVTTAQIVAGAVTASKTAVVDQTNLILDPNFTDTNYWTFTQFTPSTDTNATSAIVAPQVLASPVGNGTTSQAGSSANLIKQVPIEPGKQYRISFSAYVTAGFTGTCYATYYWYGPDGVVIGNGNTMAGYTDHRSVPAAAAAAESDSQLVTAPSNAAYMRFFPQVLWSTTLSNAGQGFMGTPRIMRATSTDLLTDNAVVASKISAGVIDNTKLVANLAAVEYVTSLPTTGNYAGRTVVLSTDGKLYRYVGSAFTSAVPTVDLTGQIQTAQIAANAVGNGQLAANSVDVGNIVNSAITSAKIASGAVIASSIASGVIDNSKLVGNLAAVELVSALPSTGNFQGRVVMLTTDGKLYRWNSTATTGTASWSAAVATADITGTIGSSQIAVGAVGTAQLADTAITSAKIAANAVTSTQIAANAVTAANIAAAVIDNSKLVNNLSAVEYVTSLPTTGNYAGRTVVLSTDGKLYRYVGSAFTSVVPATDITGTLVSAQIGANAITATQIADGSVSTPELAANAVTAAKIAANTITAGQIAANTITAGQIAANTITAGQIAANTITAGQIAAGTITATQLAANSVTATQIAVGDFQNLAWNGDFQNGSANWSLTTGITIGADSTNGWNGSAEVMTLAPSASTVYASNQNIFPVKAGDELYLDWWGKAGSALTGLVYPYIRFNNSAGTQIATLSVGALSSATPVGVYTEFANKIVVPTGAVAAYINVNAGNTAGTAYIGSILCYRRNKGSVLVDGTITATQIAASTITSAQIAANTITSTNIAAQTITSAQIASNTITTRNMVIAAGNLVANADFGTGDLTNWRPYSAPTSVSVVANTASGVPAGAPTQYVGKFAYAGPSSISVFAATSAYSDTGASTDGFAVTPGQSYFVGVSLAKSTDYTSGVIDVYAFFWKNDGTYTTNIKSIEISSTTITNAWADFTGSFVAPTGAQRCWMYVIANTVTAGQLYFSNLRTWQMAGGSLIVDGAITAQKIAANTITAGQIAAGTITTTQIAAATITGGDIAANTISAGNLVANTITAAQIATGTITATQLAVNSITASKLAVGDVTNYVQDPQFTDSAYWSLLNNAAFNTTDTTQLSAMGVSSAVKFTGAGMSAGVQSSAIISGNQMFSLEGGKSYRLDAQYYISAGYTGQLRIILFWYKAGGTAASVTYSNVIVGNYTVTAAPSNIYGDINGIVTAPPDALYGRYALYSDWSTTLTNAGIAYFAYPIMNRATSGELIVDGAITSTKIAAATITGTNIAGTTITGANIVAGTLTTTQMQAGGINADRLVANSITATQLAANSVTAAAIAANTITAAKIAAGTITTTEIAANTITAADIAANTITAGQIAAGTITAAQLAVNSITASKLVVGDITNYVQDPTFSDAAYWVCGNGASFNATDTAQLTAMGVSSGVKFLGTGLANNVQGYATVAASQYPTIEGGKSYRVDTQYYVVSGFNGQTNIVVYWFKPDGTSATPAYSQAFGPDYRTTAATTDSFADLTGIVVAPADAFKARFEVYVQWGASPTGTAYMAYPIMQRATSGELIVDGSITATKIAANTITASQIATGTITATQIAANTITATQLAANTITANQIQVGLMSQNLVYNGDPDVDVVGVAGWYQHEVSGTPSSTFTVASTATSGWGSNRFNMSKATTASGIAWACRPFAVVPGETYNITWGDAADSATAAGRYARIVYASVMPSTGQITSANRSNYTELVGIGGPWITTPTNYSANWTCPAGIHVAAFAIYSWVNGPLNIALDHVSVVCTSAAGVVIGPGTITADSIAANSITANQITAGSITGDRLVANTITATQIAANTITAAQIAASTITTGQIAAATITGGNIAANTITATQIAANTITAGQIAAGTITATQIAANAITASKLFVGDVANFIQDPSFQDSAYWQLGGGGTFVLPATDATALTAMACASALKSQTGNGTASQSAQTATIPITQDYTIEGGATYRCNYTTYVTAGFTGIVYITVYWYKADNATAASVGSTIVPNFIDHRNVAASAAAVATINGNIVAPMDALYARVQLIIGWSTTLNNAGTAYLGYPIMNRAADGSLVVDGSITAAKIAANTITATQIAANTITTTQIAAATITGGDIAANTISANNLVANTITAGQIAAGAIGATQIAAGAITATQIAANTITAAKIAAGTITATELAANSVTATQIAANVITAAKIVNGTITSTQIAAATITGTNIAAGTIAATNIIAGTITGDRLAAGTITGDKISSATSLPASLTIGTTGFNLSTIQQATAAGSSGGNRVSMSEFGGGGTTAGWAVNDNTTGSSVNFGSNSTNGINQLYLAATATAASQLISITNDYSTPSPTSAGTKKYPFKVTAGEQIAISFRGLTNGAAYSHISIAWLNSAGNISPSGLGETVVADISGNANGGLYGGIITVPAGAVAGVFVWRVYSAAAGALGMNFWNPMVTSASPGQTALPAYSPGSAGDPAATINANTTQINPGNILISGGTTLANWRNGGDTTKIEGGAIAANTITANKLTIGNRNLNFPGLSFQVTNGGNTLSWPQAYAQWIDVNGNMQQVTIPAGSFTPGNSFWYIVWSEGSTALAVTADSSYATRSDYVCLCTWYSPGYLMVQNYGGTIIDGSIITTGSITADRLNVISLSSITAQIGLLRTASSGQRTEIDNNGMRAYDTAGTLRVRVGVW